MTDQKYNGWSNKPTWLVNVWFNPETKADVRMIKDMMSESDFTITDGETGSAGPLNGALNDILSWAIAHVNWHELENAMDDDEADEDELSDDWTFEHHTGGGWRGIRNDAETDEDVTVYCSSRDEAVQSAIEIEAGE